MRRLARASLGAAAVTAAILNGCVVTSTEEHESVTRPPFLVAHEAEPPVFQVVRVPVDQPVVVFKATVFAEDKLVQNPSGIVDRRRLQSVLLIDFEPGPPRTAHDYAGGLLMDPGGRFDTPRDVEISYDTKTRNLAPGCHTATMMVSHSFKNLQTGEVWDSTDTSMLVWYLSVCDASGNCSMEGCPGLTTTTDAGAPSIDGGEG